jgi:hypothetical protein
MRQADQHAGEGIDAGAIAALLDAIADRIADRLQARPVRDDDELIDIATAAAEFAIGDESLRENVAIPKYRPGRKLLVRRGDVRAFVLSSSVMEKRKPKRLVKARPGASQLDRVLEQAGLQ